MNGLEFFLMGYVLGVGSTFAGIMIFAKYMTNKEVYVEAGREKIKLSKAKGKE